MTTKKETTHESLMQNIVNAEKALKEAQETYKTFCKENPLELPKAPTLHEARLMREKNEKVTLEDHKKANKLAADKAKVK